MNSTIGQKKDLFEVLDQVGEMNKYQALQLKLLEKKTFQMVQDFFQQKRIKSNLKNTIQQYKINYLRNRGQIQEITLSYFLIFSKKQKVKTKIIFHLRNTSLLRKRQQKIIQRTTKSFNFQNFQFILQLLIMNLQYADQIQ
ncbi:unnamed protein product [Paramecium sonneborni]|uniref:Uncharacterized protein n=1 Tax=Paramecium sonneborni TaxID=65129 RepID=A0A8S1QSL8_9CILI|nr:unnamed protein product [Paramecium sonneborni]